MFLVNDDKPEVFKFNVGLNQFVGADDQVHGARRQPGNSGFHLFGGAKARQFFNANRPRCEAILERVEVLLGQ